MFRLRKKTGQSILEYTTLVVIVIGALIAMTFYMKRGIQGRWKDTIDSMGDQYDPDLVDSQINESMSANVFTNLYTQPGEGGRVTYRNDTSDTIESKNGYIIVGPQTDENIPR